MKTTTRTRILGLAAAALLLPLAGVSAQSRDAAPSVSAADAGVTMHEVTSLAEAARRYRASAARQVHADAARSYVRAGHLAYEAGAWEQALDDLTRGAKRAIAAGDLAGASAAMVDAAWVSLKLRNVQGAVERVEKTRALMKHAALPDGERRRLEHRLDRLGLG